MIRGGVHHLLVEEPARSKIAPGLEWYLDIKRLDSSLGGEWKLRARG